MKRRNADCGKIRRPIKRNKIAEGMYGSSTILYMKFLILWAIVITADFMFMFRFEFLWPFWLLLRSVHDSFKYKGLAFSVLFVCIAITSDLVCLFFIPVHWLLFAASTYVWVQYVWHTDKGICLPTIILWMLFVYLEAGIRWKDSRHMPHLDLCRPFAAHCIGYPVVTLGFGFKSYVGYKMRQRKQREVAKENEFYMQLLQQALPQDEALDDIQNINGNSVTTAGTIPVAQSVQANSVTSDHGHHHNQSNAHHGDEKIHIPLIGHLISSQTTHTAIQQHQSNNHHHHNNINSSNSSSSNRNAQTNSKLNNVSNSTTTATANGHVTNNMNGLTTSHKSQRRSVDKDKTDTTVLNNSSSNSNSNSNRSGTTNSTADVFTSTNNNINNSSKISNPYLNQINNMSNHIQKDVKDKESWDSSASSTSSTSSSNNSVNSGKEGKENKNYNSNYEISNGNHTAEKKTHLNGNIVHYDVEEPTETTEKVKGRRNRSKKDTAISNKDNHTNYNNNSTCNNITSQHQQNQSLTNNSHHNHHNNHQHKDSTTSLDSTSTTTSSISSTSSNTISNVASHIVNKICETCLRLEAEIKKYQTEISHMKQIENELRQKIDANATAKSCLQAKQRENDLIEKRLQELTNVRQIDIINLQNTERRLGEERRQRQSLEAQLNNEKKARKIAEEKATRPECNEACKQRKQQIETEIKQLRRELKVVEDAKQAAEQQGRKYEQELRIFEAEVRNREAQQGTEVLMSALAAMQDKNSTLEKNLSAETRVKLDLFSALGEAKRQLEIKDSMIRNKDEEVLDLKAKIAQLLAVMPTDSLCLPPCSTTGTSMLRMTDTPPLQGPSSPMLGLGPTHQQLMAVHQLNARGGPCVVSAPNSSSNVVQNVVTSASCPSNNVVTQTSSNLDPNATAYTPKNSSLVSGAEA